MNEFELISVPGHVEHVRVRCDGPKTREREKTKQKMSLARFTGAALIQLVGVIPVDLRTETSFMRQKMYLV